MKIEFVGLTPEGLREAVRTAKADLYNGSPALAVVESIVDEVCEQIRRLAAQSEPHQKLGQIAIELPESRWRIVKDAMMSSALNDNISAKAIVDVKNVIISIAIGLEKIETESEWFLGNRRTRLVDFPR